MSARVLCGNIFGVLDKEERPFLVVLLLRQKTFTDSDLLVPHSILRLSRKMCRTWSLFLEELHHYFEITISCTHIYTHTVLASIQGKRFKP